jgi:Phage portal protein, SPP1 Gp6-like
MSDLMHAVEEIRAHADDYALAERYYNGDVDEIFASPAVKRALRGCVDSFDVNLARRPVDAVLDRVTIAAVTVPDSPQASTDLLERVWTPNRMARYSRIVHRAALIFGDAYLICWPGQEDGSVDLFYNSPITTRVFYSAENPRLKSFAAKLWREGAGDRKVTRVNLYYPDRVERWVTKPGVVGETEAEFFEYAPDGEPWPVPNSFGVIPVWHFRTDEPYGRPEHAGAFGPQNCITKLSATLMSTIDFQGFPQRYALMEATDQLVDWDDDESSAPSAESGLRASPGELWKLPGSTKVGQFDPANVDAFLKPMGLYTRLMASATATPLRFFDPQGQIPSGSALRADEAPLASRIRDREAMWSDEWSDVLRFACSLVGISAPTVDVQFAPVQVADDIEDWKTIELKLQVGVPFQQAMQEAGYSTQLVNEWMADREDGSTQGGQP